MKKVRVTGLCDGLGDGEVRSSRFNFFSVHLMVPA